MNLNLIVQQHPPYLKYLYYRLNLKFHLIEKMNLNLLFQQHLKNLKYHLNLNFR